MPDIFRVSEKLTCKGVDISHVLDRLEPGYFPYLLNARVITEGTLQARPGYFPILTLDDAPHSIRQLNDPTYTFSPFGYVYVVGAGTNLYAGPVGSFDVVDTGYSGHPLSLIPFKPDGSPESWMYVYDANKLVKVSPSKSVRPIGFAPPTTAPSVVYGVPAMATAWAGQTNLGVAFGTDTVFGAVQDRTAGATATINQISYDVGSTGWCSLHPAMTGQPSWAGERMKVTLNSGGGNVEDVLVRDIMPAFTATTIAGILYDTGATGLCSVIITGYPAGLQRGSLVLIAGAELCQVLEVVLNPAGTEYSIRLSTAGTYAAGAAIEGLYTWRVYTTLTHVTTETISANFLKDTHTTGVGGRYAIPGGGVNMLATNGGRTIDPINDYLHISVYLDNPGAVNSIKLLANMDATPNTSFTSPGNSWIWTVPSAQYLQGGSSASWVEIIIPISSGTRYGSDGSLTLAAVTAQAIQIDTASNCNWGFDWWYCFGTYPLDIALNSPVGIVYQSRFRESATNAASVPGPQTRYEVFPLRESVIITPQATNQAGVDTIDIYREGGAVTASLYVGSVANVYLAPVSFTDNVPDDDVNRLSQAPDLTLLQPWPILQLPWSGTCDVVGTSVNILSGPTLDPGLLSNTIILINGKVYLTYGQPASATRVELTQDAGVQSGVTWQIASPTTAGKPLPYCFGPLEGPFAPVIFGLGDTVNGGTLYYTNPSNADGAADSNTIELSTPSQSLVSGQVWNGLCFTGSRDEIFCVRYSYLNTTGQAGGNNTFQWAKVPSTSGFWSRWSSCKCPLGVAFLGRDGIYITTEQGAKNITDERLYPLFWHEGQPPRVVTVGNDQYYPVDMTSYDNLRLTYCDNRLYFDYKDTLGQYRTLEFDLSRMGWMPHAYANQVVYHYLVEGSATLPQDQEILLLVKDAKLICRQSGDTDNGTAIETIAFTPSYDSKDQRLLKLWVDMMVLWDGLGTLRTRAWYDSATSESPTDFVSTQIAPYLNQHVTNLVNIEDLNTEGPESAQQGNLLLYRNVALRFRWTGGFTGGPRLWGFDVSGYVQPMLTALFVTQYVPFSFPGWKHMRRAFPAILSQGEVALTIKTQDGREYGPYNLASTAGRYRIYTTMLSHGIKDLAFAIQLDGKGRVFAFWPEDFTVELKEWTEASYIKLAVFRA